MRASLARRHLAWSCLLFLSVWPAPGVLFYSTGDPAFNTNAPTRALTNSGWEFQGAWAGFSGTVISPNCFITAQHVGGVIGGTFEFQGVAYTTTAFFNNPDADIMLWRISGQFPVFAPLYTNRNERGKNLVVFGRGTQRGAEVRSGPKLKGWLWGPGDGVQRWGQNRVRAILDGGTGIGELLYASFDAGAGRNEAQLSAGDSGGAVFIKDGKFYKLAGINRAVDPPFSFTNAGPGFEAALFDRRNLYEQTAADTWTLVPNHSGRLPGGFYATRISSQLDWINPIVAEQSR